MSDNDSAFVDLNKLTKIISEEIKQPRKKSSLIPDSTQLHRSKSDDGGVLNIDSIFVPSARFNYNRDHINEIAKSLNLISDIYKDVKVDLPLKESLLMLQQDDIEVDANDDYFCTCYHGCNNCKIHPFGQNNNKNFSAPSKTTNTTTSSLKSCMKKISDDEDDPQSNSGNHCSKAHSNLDRLGLVNFKPVVSFDTVPLGSLSAADIDNNIIKPEDYFTEEEWYDNEMDEPYQDAYVGYKGLQSSAPSGSFKSLQSVGSNIVNELKNLQILEGYSTSPYIDNSALIINKKHPLYDDLEKDKKRKSSVIKKKRKYDIRLPITKTSNGLNKVPIDKRFRRGTNAAALDPTDKRVRTLKKINRETGWINQGRAVLIHISGRRHSWVALDYVISKIVNNGDKLIVCCNLPKENKKERMTRRKDRINRKIKLQKLKSKVGSDFYDSDNESENSDYEDVYDRNETHWKNGYTYDEVEETLNDLIKYVHLLLPADKIIKLTCEISVDDMREAVINAYNCYLPKMVVITTKKWQHDEKVGEARSKLVVDVLVNNLPCPIVVVPAKKSDSFENYIKERLKLTTDLTIPKEEKVIKLHEINKKLLMIDRPLLPFMLLKGNGNSYETIKAKKELQLQEFTTENVNADDNDTINQLANILKIFKNNLDFGLYQIDQKYPEYTNKKKSLDIMDLVVEQSAKYNENFNKIGSATDLDPTVNSLKEILSQGENFKPKKQQSSVSLNSSSGNTTKSVPSIVINQPPSISFTNKEDLKPKPYENRTIKLHPTISPRNHIQGQSGNTRNNQNDMALKKYNTMSYGDTNLEAVLSNDTISDNGNKLRKTITSTSQKSDEKKKKHKGKFSLRKLFGK